MNEATEHDAGRGRQERTPNDTDFRGSRGSSIRCPACWVAIVRRRTQRVRASVMARFAPRDRELVQDQGGEKTLFCGLFARLFASYSPALLLVSAAEQNDLLSDLFEQFSDWAWHLNPIAFSFLYRATSMLSLSVFFLWLAYHSGRSRSVLLQAFILMNSLIISFVIPVPLNIPYRLVKTWVVASCLFLTAVTPSLLPLWLCSELGNQRRVRRIAYSVLLFGFIGSLLRALPPWTH
jgi:hypothetical protein